jgi:hypothetical protein
MGQDNKFTLKKSMIAMLAVISLGVAGLSLTACDQGGMSAQAAEGSGKGQHGGKGGTGKGGAQSGGKGYYQRGSTDKSVDAILEEEVGEDSDRPDWAGVSGKEGKPGEGKGGSGGSDRQKGEDYGDLWVILRDDNGVPILKDGFVQPLDANGNPVPLDEEGHPLDENLVVEVELGRLNIARAPEKVLDHSLVEALKKLDEGTVITLDPAGRLVVDGDTIDSPLESLALFKAILTTPAVDTNGDGVADMITLTTTGTVDGQDVTYSFDISLEQAGLVAASAIAAASDKTGTLTVDEVMYIAKFLGLDEQLSQFVTTFNYERDDVYNDNLTVWVLVGQDTNGDGVPDIYVPQEVVINQVVNFNDVPTIVDNGVGIDDFAQAAEDSVQVLEYVHDNALDQ